MNILLNRVLDRLVRSGNLKVTGPNGSTSTFGDGSGDLVHIHIKTAHAERAITFDPMLAVPESYMDGELDILEGGVLGLMRIAFTNMGSGGIDATWSKAIEGLRHAFRRLQQINTTSRSRRNVLRSPAAEVSGASLMMELDRAIENDVLVMFYQPKFHVRRQQVTCAEALIRWRHPERGMIPPGDFIAAAEEADLIDRLTLWTIRRVIADQARFREAGHDLRLFVNLSGQLLADTAFIEQACEMITGSDATLGFVAAAFRRHAELLVEFFEDEGRGCRDIRKHVAWYFKGYPVGGETRAQLATVSSLAEIDDLIATLDLDAPYPGAAAEGQRGRAGTPKRPALPDGWLHSREMSGDAARELAEAEVDTSGG